MADLPSLYKLFHDFRNAVDNINLPTQSFAIAVDMVGLDKAMEVENVSVNKKIESIVDTAKEGYNKCYCMLKLISGALDKKDIKGYKHFIDGTTQKLEEIVVLLDKIKTINQNTKDNDVSVMVEEMLKIGEICQSISSIIDSFRENLISRGVYYNL